MRRPHSPKKEPAGKDAPKGKRKLEFKEKKSKGGKLPLSDKVIYIDIKDVRQHRKVEEDLQILGARVDTFLSKDIHYMITSQARPVASRSDVGSQSPASPADVNTPSPFNCGPSPNPSGPKVPPETVCRGKAILQQAKTDRKLDTQDSTPLICKNAEKLGVKIVGLEAALKWIQKEMAKLPASLTKRADNSSKKVYSKLKKLKSPYIKFEAVSRQYKAIQQHLDVWPRANTNTPRGTCPFDGTAKREDRSREERGDRIGLIPLEPGSPETPSGDGESVPSGNKPRRSIVGGVRIVTAGEIRRQKEQKRLQERKRGYCECCEEKYEDLFKHIVDDKHKSFVRDKKNYKDLDRLIRSGQNQASFLQKILHQHLNKKSEASFQSRLADEDLLSNENQHTEMSNKAHSTKEVNSPRKSRHSPRKSTAESSTCKGSYQHRGNPMKSPSVNHFSPLDSDPVEVTRKSPRISIAVGKDTEGAESTVKGHYFPSRTNNFIVVHHRSGTENPKSVETFQPKISKENRNLQCKREIRSRNSRAASKSHCKSTQSKDDQVLGGLSGKEGGPSGKEGINEESVDLDVLKKENNRDKRFRKMRVEGDSVSDEVDGDTCTVTDKSYGVVKGLKNSNEILQKKNEEKEDSVWKVAKHRDSFGVCPSNIQEKERLCSEQEKTEEFSGVCVEQKRTREVSSFSDERKKNGEASLYKDFKKTGREAIEGTEILDKRCLRKRTVSTAMENAVSLEDENTIHQGSVKTVKAVQKQCKSEEFKAAYVLQEKNSDKIHSSTPSAHTLSSENIINSPKNLIHNLKSEDKETSRGKHTATVIDKKEGKIAIEQKNFKGSTRKEAAIKNGNQVLSSPFRAAVSEIRRVQSSSLVTSEVESYSQPTVRDCEDGEGKKTVISPSHYQEHVMEACDFVDKIQRLRTTSRRMQSVDDKVKILSEGSPKVLSRSENADKKKKFSVESVESGERKSVQTCPPSPKFSRSPASRFKKQCASFATTCVKDSMRTPTTSVSGRSRCYSYCEKGTETREKDSQNKVDSKVPNVSVTKAKSKASGMSGKSRKRHEERHLKKHTLDRSDRGQSSLQDKTDTESSKNYAHSFLIGAPDKSLDDRRTSRKDNGIKNATDVSVAKSVRKTSSSTFACGFEIATLPFKAAQEVKHKTPTKLAHDKKTKKKKSQKSASFSMTWQHAKGSTPRCKGKKVKLNKSWSLLTDRSVLKLLHSEQDGDDNFEGFEPEVLMGSALGSEVSYEETNEIEIEDDPNHEWCIGEEEEDKDENLSIYVPQFLSSPGLRSNSSWGEACDVYIDSQLSFNKGNSSIVLRSSPRKSPWKQKFSPVKSPCKVRVQHSLDKISKRKRISSIDDKTGCLSSKSCVLSPKRRKIQSASGVTFLVDGIEKVDDDIEFNYLSPQKTNAAQVGEKLSSSSPVLDSHILKTSTPHTNNDRKGRFKRKSLAVQFEYDHGTTVAKDFPQLSPKVLTYDKEPLHETNEICIRDGKRTRSVKKKESRRVGSRRVR